MDKYRLMLRYITFLIPFVFLIHACTQGLLDRTPPGDTLATSSLLRHAILMAGGGAISFSERHTQQKTKGRRKKCHEYKILQTIISDEPLIAEEASPFLRFFGFGTDEEEPPLEQTTENQGNTTQDSPDDATSGEDDSTEEAQTSSPDIQEQEEDIVTEETVSEAVSRQVETYLEAERAIVEESVNSWKELWVVKACGVVSQIELRFIADGKGGTLVHVPFEAISLYTPP